MGRAPRPPHGMCAMIERRISLWPRSSMSVRYALVALIFAGVGVGSPSPVSGQEADARRLEDALPAEYAARVREIAREARAAGVPPGLIARKAFEGVAKGHPPERIVPALDAYAGRLREAAGLLGADRRPGSISAAAEALRRGVPPDAIRSMASRERAGRELAAPLIVLSDLTEAGVPTEDALEMVNSAMDRGARGDQMLGLSAAVRRRMRQGADWRTAVDDVRRRVERQFQLRDRRPPSDGARPGQNPSRRPAGTVPVPPGTEPPHRQRDGG